MEAASDDDDDNDGRTSICKSFERAWGRGAREDGGFGGGEGASSMLACRNPSDYRPRGGRSIVFPEERWPMATVGQSFLAKIKMIKKGCPYAVILHNTATLAWPGHFLLPRERGEGGG